MLSRVMLASSSMSGQLNDMPENTSSVASSVTSSVSSERLTTTRLPPSCCGFFQKVSIAPWTGFHLDLPIILNHPMLQRLERLDLDVGQEQMPGTGKNTNTATLPDLPAELRAIPGAEKVFIHGKPLRE